jgi:transcription-repair coupling factor (superfamily II helicase)
MSLRPLLEIAEQNERLRALRSALGSGGEAVDAYVSAAMRPYLLAALIAGEDDAVSGPVLVVAADDRSARDLAGDLKAFLSPRPVHIYPSRGTTFESHLDPPPHLAGLRIAAMNAMADPSAVVVASAIALAEKIPDPKLRPETLALHKGESVDLDDVTLLLADAGYERTDQVEERGQFALRGGILDVYPATEEQAIRVELFGDEIDSMRRFSVFTQRSLGEADRVELAPAAELSAEHRDAVDPADFLAPLDLVPAEALVAIAAAEEIPGALHDHWEDVTASILEEDARRLYVDVADPLQARAGLSLGADTGQEHSFRAQRAEFPSRTLGEAEGELEKLTRSGYRTVVAFEGRGEAERTRFNLNRIDVPFLGENPPEGAGVSFAEAR